MFACDPDARGFAVEVIQRIQMLKNNITQLPRRQCIGHFLARKQSVDIAKNPRCAMARATDHYSVRAGMRKYCVRLLR
jgi:hypothetical protein